MDQTTLIPLIAAAACCGAGFFFFLRRSSAGDAAPAAGSAFAKYGFNLRLRDLFRLAVLIEEDGIKAYLRLKSGASTPEARALCAWLAEEEERHRAFAQEHLDKWRELAPHRLEWPKFMEKVKEQGFFADPPPAGATEPEVAAFALKQEIKSAEFYKLFQASFPEAWKRSRLDRLVQEELNHEARLRAAYPSLR